MDIIEKNKGKSSRPTKASRKYALASEDSKSHSLHSASQNPSHKKDIRNKDTSALGEKELPKKSKSSEIPKKQPVKTKKKFKPSKEKANIELCGYEMIGEPRKSDNDKKEYRLLKLDNGIVCCLISDGREEIGDDSESSLSSEGEDNMSDSSEESNYEESTTEVEGTDAFHDSMTLKNKTAPEEKLAAVALCIGAGSFNDPLDIPGLAHFLEHMVFMGSDKYPAENDFDSFIKNSGGDNNAATDCEYTTFLFECLEKYLHKGIDKFAQFFIAPLLNKESMLKERQAIDAEFAQAMPKDEYRIEQLFFNMFKSQAKICPFSWGNLQTLLYNNMTDDELYERLHNFRKEYYTANRMTLAIQARLPMETLLKYVREHFGGIPTSNEIKRPHYTKFAGKVFDDEEFNKIYFIKPTKDVIEMTLTWKMPTKLHLYKSKPHVYIASLLGDESQGSLISYLRKKVWALSIRTGNEESNSDHNSLYYLFQVSLTLTADGFAKYKDVISAVFSYINLLKTNGISKRYFDELKTISETELTYQDEESAVDNVELIAENLHIYPPTEVLAGPVLFQKFNEIEIKKILDGLTPLNMNVMILSPRLPDPELEFDKYETWFQTHFTTQDLSTELIETWTASHIISDFTIPNPNTFLTRDFHLYTDAHVEEDDPVSPYPRKLTVKNHFCELWYKKDKKFLLPQAYYNFYLINSKTSESPEYACMAELFLKLCSIQMSEDTYPALVAQLNYSVELAEKGLIVKVWGYNQKLPELLHLIAKYIRNVAKNTSFDMFEVMKQKLQLSYYNKFIKVGMLARDLRLRVLVGKHYTLLQKHEALGNITYKRFLDFAGLYLDKIYLQGLVQGNVEERTAYATTIEFFNALECKHLPRAPWLQVYQLPLGEFCIRTKSLNKNDNNSVVTNYYQVGPYEETLSVSLELLMLIIDEPLFDTLRTKKGLGYQVYCTLRDTFGILGYTITVISQEDKHSVAVVEDSIEKFRKKIGQILHTMSQKKFKTYVSDLIKIKRISDTQLKEEVDRNWHEITSLFCFFHRNTKEIKALEELKLSHLTKFWDQLNSVHSKGKFHKLSIQVVGHPKGHPVNPLGLPKQSCSPKMRKKSTFVSESTMETSETDRYKPQIYKLDFTGEKEDCWNEKKPEDYFIRNLEIFVSNLHFFPSNVRVLSMKN